MLLLRIGRDNAARLSAWKSGKAASVLEVNFQADDGKVELEFSIYELERRDEIIRAAAEHAASFQIVGPPRRSAHADFVGSGTCQVKPGTSNFAFTRAAHRNIKFDSEEALLAALEGILREGRLHEVEPRDLGGYIRAERDVRNPEWLAFLATCRSDGSSLLARRRRRPQRPAPSEVGEPKEKLKSMHYVRPFPASEPVAPVELTDEEFEAIRIARQGVLRVLGVEEKFDILLANYLQLEGDLLSIALESTVILDWSWESFIEDLQLSNRRVANLLAAGRMYLDHACHDLTFLYGTDSEVLAAFRLETNRQYDTRLGYRVMEAVRNVALHRGLPIQVFSYPNVSVEAPGATTRKLRFGAVAFMMPQSLEEEGGLKPSILVELKQLGERVDVLPLVREYVAGLSSVHERLRELSDRDVLKWEATLNAVQLKVAEAAGGARDVAVCHQ